LIWNVRGVANRTSIRCFLKGMPTRFIGVSSADSSLSTDRFQYFIKRKKMIKVEPRSRDLFELGPIDIGAMGPIVASEIGTEAAGSNPDQLAFFVDKRTDRQILEDLGQRDLFK